MQHAVWVVAVPSHRSVFYFKCRQRLQSDVVKLSTVHPILGRFEVSLDAATAAAVTPGVRDRWTDHQQDSRPLAAALPHLSLAEQKVLCGIVLFVPQHSHEQIAGLQVPLVTRKWIPAISCILHTAY